MKTIIVIMLATISSYSLACSCDRESFEKIISDSKYIFVATITATKINGSGEEFLRGVAANFKAEKSFKGNPKKLKKLYSGFGGGDCGLPFNVGFQYLIFTNDGTVDICTRSQMYPGIENDDGFSEQISEFLKTGKKIDTEDVFFVDQSESCSE